MRRNHRSGLSILGMVALLIATGYGLYYVGDEQARPWISCVHWLIGLAAAGMAPLHVVLGRRRTAGNLATGRA
jgi:choline-glycine betaine transporter